MEVGLLLLLPRRAFLCPPKTLPPELRTVRKREKQMRAIHKLGAASLVVATVVTIGLSAAGATTTPTTRGIPADPGATVTYTVTANDSGVTP